MTRDEIKLRVYDTPSHRAAEFEARDRDERLTLDNVTRHEISSELETLMDSMRTTTIETARRMS